jgi:DNA invertase Pin-like site-specific DNA recombinase
MNNYFGYMRISTREEREKQKFSRQEHALENYEKKLNINFHTISKDDKSGKDFEREGWKKLEAILHSGDTVVFKDLSRFTRNFELGYKKYMELLDKGIDLIFLDNYIINTDYIKNMISENNKQNRITKLIMDNLVELIIKLELDRVENERLLISERTKAGLLASGKKSGRKDGSILKMNEELKKDIKNYLEDRTITKADLIKKHNISRNTLSKYITMLSSDRLFL